MNKLIVFLLVLVVLLSACAKEIPPEVVTPAGIVLSVEYLQDGGLFGAVAKTIITTDSQTIVVVKTHSIQLGSAIELVENGDCVRYYLCARIVGSDVLWGVYK